MNEATRREALTLAIQLVTALDHGAGTSAARIAGECCAVITRNGVMLINCDEHKIKVVRALRDVLSLGLIDAEALADAAPCTIPCSDPEKLRAALTAAGATVE